MTQNGSRFLADHLFYSFYRALPYELPDIVAGDDHHEDDEECEAHRVHRARHGRPDAPARDALDDDEEEPPAVERRDRDQVDEREVDRDQS